jgi:acyl carrier protein
MTTNEALQLLERLLQQKPNTLTPALRLWDIEDWDSLAAMTLIAVVDRELKVRLSGSRIAAAQTVADLLSMLQEGLAGRAA